MRACVCVCCVCMCICVCMCVCMRVPLNSVCSQLTLNQGILQKNNNIGDYAVLYFRIEDSAIRYVLLLIKRKYK